MRNGINDNKRYRIHSCNLDNNRQPAAANRCSCHISQGIVGALDWTYQRNASSPVMLWQIVRIGLDNAAERLHQLVVVRLEYRFEVLLPHVVPRGVGYEGGKIDHRRCVPERLEIEHHRLGWLAGSLATMWYISISLEKS